MAADNGHYSCSAILKNKLSTCYKQAINTLLTAIEVCVLIMMITAFLFPVAPAAFQCDL